MGFIDIENLIDVALECLFVAMEGLSVSFKDMESVIIVLIRCRYLEEEARMDPKEKKLKERFLVDELTRCG